VHRGSLSWPPHEPECRQAGDEDDRAENGPTGAAVLDRARGDDHRREHAAQRDTGLARTLIRAGVGSVSELKGERPVAGLGQDLGVCATVASVGTPTTIASGRGSNE
jgi:hypothetical protein